MTYRPVPAEGVVVEYLDDEACLYRPDIDEVLVLNGTATEVWRLCDGTAGTEEITASVSRVHGVPAQGIAPDVEAVVDELRRRGYLIDSE